MDRLTEAFQALGAHITRHGHRGSENGINEVAADLGMVREDLSEDNTLEVEWKLFDGDDALTLSYVAHAMVEFGNPFREHYSLERSGSVSDLSEWSFADGECEAA